VAKSHSAQLRRNVSVALTLIGFIAAFFVVRWIVTTQRSPGAITVIEAQGMDMGAMKPPRGTQPVKTVIARPSFVSGFSTFPATVMALSDEEIVARIPGSVTKIAYPGDRVSAGQVVVEIDAKEYLAQARGQQLMASSAKYEAVVAAREIERAKSARAQAQAAADAADSAISKAQADLDAAIADQRVRLAELDSKKAMVDERKAEAVFAKQVLERKRALYQADFISLNEYQAAVADEASRAARLNRAMAELAESEQANKASEAKVLAAQQEVRQANAMSRSARAAVSAAETQVSVAMSQAKAKASEASASQEQASASGTIADYTHLKALGPGIVVARFVGPGSVVSAGQRLLMLHDASLARVQAQVPETLSGKVLVGTPVRVNQGTKSWQARVTSVFPSADASTRTFTVEALIANPDHELLPGSFATVDVQTEAGAMHLAVPSSAVQSSASAEPYVWIAIKSEAGAQTDWTCPMHTQVSLPGPGRCPICKMELIPRTRSSKTVATRRPVTIGVSGRGLTAILSGLKEGDEVIVDGFATLVEGSPVSTTLIKSDESATSKIRSAAARQSEPKRSAKLVQLYVCPMHPEVVQDRPGKCPKCGMDLVPKKGCR